jgi:molybdopterin molybdotransferase
MDYLKNISRHQALKLILDSIHPMETINLALEQALGYAAANDVYASSDIPSFDRSAMDGYAISSKDTAAAAPEHPIRLKVVGEIRPSTAELVSMEKGQAVRIMTGGSIPPGADAVVKEEDVEYSAGTIEVTSGVLPSQHVWPKGKDIRTGTVVVERGKPLTPAVMAVLASLQTKDVAVTRKPDVFVLAVGNELADIHDTARDHKIVASNIYMLSAMIRQLGGRLSCAKISSNENSAIRTHIEEGLQSDMLITTGGSSNAYSDLTRALMEEIGVDLKFAGVSMRPGKGTSFGLYENKPIFSLPGTPSAVFVVFYTLVVPALFRLMGLASGRMSCIQASLEQDVKKKPGVEHLIQGSIRQQDSHYSVLPLAGPDVGVFHAMSRANGLIIVDPDQSQLKQGQKVSVQPLNPFEAVFPRASSQPVPIPKKQGIMAPMVSIVGKSDSGKTTLLEKLVPELTARGFRIGTIKHDVHGFDIDHEGKDSWRHKQAGANTVAISSPKKVAVIKDVEAEETLEGLSSKYFQDVDIILTEGYKRENKPKIEIFRSQVHDEPLCKSDDSLVALVSDTPLDLGVPRFELDDIKGLADLVERKFLLKT